MEQLRVEIESNLRRKLFDTLLTLVGSNNYKNVLREELGDSTTSEEECTFFQERKYSDDDLNKILKKSYRFRIKKKEFKFVLLLLLCAQRIANGKYHRDFHLSKMELANEILKLEREIISKAIPERYDSRWKIYWTEGYKTIENSISKVYQSPEFKADLQVLKTKNILEIKQTTIIFLQGSEKYVNGTIKLPSSLISPYYTV
jgi:hypothetical protein